MISIRNVAWLKRQTFIKNFIKKIDLTRTSRKVTYDLAHLLVVHEDGSTLKDNMVEAAGIEPASENLPTEHLHTYPVF